MKSLEVETSSNHCQKYSAVFDNQSSVFWKMLRTVRIDLQIMLGQFSKSSENVRSLQKSYSVLFMYFIFYFLHTSVSLSRLC